MLDEASVIEEFLKKKPVSKLSMLSEEFIKKSQWIGMKENEVI